MSIKSDYQSRLDVIEGAPHEVIDVVSRILNQTYLSERELSARTGLSRKYFQKHRRLGDGPPYFDFGHVRYPVSGVRLHELSKLRRDTSDPGPGTAPMCEWFLQLAEEAALLRLICPSEGR